MLVTGSTGAVGAELVEQARQAGWEVVGCSTRGGQDAVPWRMGAEAVPTELRRRWDVVVHAAARPRWNLPLEEAYSANVAPVADLAPLVGANGHLVHISTAFAVGLRGTTTSNDPKDYRNSYEWSKAFAEREVVRRYDATVVRPPLVIGRRSDGWISRYSGLYSLLQAALSGLMPAFIGEPAAPSAIVTTCDIASCVLQLSRTGPTANPVVLGNVTEDLPVLTLMKCMYEALNEFRARAGADPLDVPKLIPPERWDRFYLPFVRPHLSTRQLRTVELLGLFIPYMSLAEPPLVSWPVPPVACAVTKATMAWSADFQRLALGTPRPWATKASQ